MFRLSLLLFLHLYFNRAGVAALYWDQDPNLSVRGLVAKLISTSTEASIYDAGGPSSGIAMTIATFVTDVGTGPPGTDCGRYSAAPPAIGVFSLSSSSWLVMSVSTVAACYIVSMIL